MQPVVTVSPSFPRPYIFCSYISDPVSSMRNQSLLYGNLHNALCIITQPINYFCFCAFAIILFTEGLLSYKINSVNSLIEHN